MNLTVQINFNDVTQSLVFQQSVSYIKQELNSNTMTLECFKNKTQKNIHFNRLVADAANNYVD